MICWVSTNPISHTVMKSSGKTIKHLSQFDKTELQPSVFYGMLRGASKAMHILKRAGIDYWYIDNGYYSAKYIDHRNFKDMDGTYRIVKNDTHHLLKNGVAFSGNLKSILLIPPSPYSAMFHDTLPEDWINQSIKYLGNLYPDVRFVTRNKNSNKSLESDISETDAVFSFNSMSVIKAIEMGKPVCDTHGIIRDMGFKLYRYVDVMNYYKDKQTTLDKLKDWAWL